MGMPLAARLRYDSRSVDATDADSPSAATRHQDAELVGRARKGDYEAFEELVRRYRNEVFAVAYHYVRNREEAWDLSQEVFIKAHRGLKSFRGDASFKTWLLRITANRCKDHFKKRRLKTVALEDMDGRQDPAAVAPEPDQQAQHAELGRAIQEALGTLSDKHRTAFILREYEGLSYGEIAEAMGCSMGTVMSRLHHARKKMQKALIELGVVEEQ